VFPVVAKATKALGIETIKVPMPRLPPLPPSNIPSSVPLHAFAQTRVQVKGIEADDLIACYTKIARAQGHRVGYLLQTSRNPLSYSCSLPYGSVLTGDHSHQRQGSNAAHQPHGPNL